MGDGNQMSNCSEETLTQLKNTLHNTGSTPSTLAEQFRVLFTLKAIGKAGNTKAIDYIGEALEISDSALLKHEVAYVLGQCNNSHALPTLEKTLQNLKEDPMVRHEAAEAIGAISLLYSIPFLRQYLHDPNDSVRETCEIAIAKIEYDHKQSSSLPQDRADPSFPTIDPAPANLCDPAAVSTSDVEKIRERYLDSSQNLFDRYRSMFTLRDIANSQSGPRPAISNQAVLALAAGFRDKSALYRHEIAYIFGQLSHPASVPSLVEVLTSAQEESMVRHEAAEALGGMGSDADLAHVKSVLSEYAVRPDVPQVVRESCIVALDMWEYEASQDFQYANGLDDSARGVAVSA